VPFAAQFHFNQGRYHGNALALLALWLSRLPERGMPGEVERYRGYAAECLRLAEAVDDSSGKARLLQMAQAWRRLAEQHEKNSDDDRPNGEG
jgi:hypothetical protein